MEEYLLKMSDDELQKLISHENQEVFTIIFNQYRKKLYSYAFIHLARNQYTVDYNVVGKPNDYQMKVFTLKVIAESVF